MSPPLRIHCLHTSDAHVATFRRLFGEAAPSAAVSETVRADWLAEARANGLTAELRHEIGTFLAAKAAEQAAVLCTCSTLGPVADEMSEASANIVRIDSPLMRAAVQHDGPLLVALCLESTRAPTISLLEAAFAATGKSPNLRVAMCTAAWAHFENGDIEAFAGKIAATIRAYIAAPGPVAAIVLAQASMAAAEARLASLNVPVYASPRLAVAETLRVAAVSKMKV